MVRSGWTVSLVMVTLTLDVASLPASSNAVAVSTCAPLGVPTLSQLTTNGAADAPPIQVPSSLNTTPVTPTSSDAVADTWKAPATSAPAAGAVMVTVGAVESGSGAGGFSGVSTDPWRRSVSYRLTRPFPSPQSRRLTTPSSKYRPARRWSSSGTRCDNNAAAPDIIAVLNEVPETAEYRPPG